MKIKKKFKVIWNGKIVREFNTKKEASEFVKDIILDKYDVVEIK